MFADQEIQVLVVGHAIGFLRGISRFINLAIWMELATNVCWNVREEKMLFTRMPYRPFGEDESSRSTLNLTVFRKKVPDLIGVGLDQLAPSCFESIAYFLATPGCTQCLGVQFASID